MPRQPTHTFGKEKLRRIAISSSVVAALAAALILLWLLGSASRAATAETVPALSSLPAGREYQAPAPNRPLDVTPIHYVSISGTDSGDCSTPAGACRTIQYAVDWVGEGDEIRVATGVYTGVQARQAPDGYLGPPIITQAVYISKSLTVRGGFTANNWSTANPVAYPTTLDVQGHGRVLFVGGAVTATIEGLEIRGGNAHGLGGQCADGNDDCDTGGGIYVITATAAISACRIYSNSAEIGGGLYIERSGSAVESNVVSSNTALIGGGMVLFFSPAKLDSNVISHNSAILGGALWSFVSSATLSRNMVSHNSCKADGGGLLLDHCDTIRLNSNTILSNTGGRGGGVAVWDGYAVFDNNVIADNSAGSGAGLQLRSGANALFRHNTVADNRGGDGVGVMVGLWGEGSDVVMSNTILVSHNVGLFVEASGEARLGATLWGNETDWDGGGRIFTGTNNLWGNPAFLAPDGGDYHIGIDSAAIDAGVNAGLTTDIDGDARPDRCFPDLGADEYTTGMECERSYLPLVVRGE